MQEYSLTLYINDKPYGISIQGVCLYILNRHSFLYHTRSTLDSVNDFFDFFLFWCEMWSIMNRKSNNQYLMSTVCGTIQNITSHGI